MRAISSALLAGLALSLVAFPAGAATMFVANLEAAQEVPPSTALGFGVASLQLTLDTQNHLAFALVVTPTFDFTAFGGGGAGGSDVLGLHIHNAARGANGPVVFGMIAPNSDTDGDLMFSNLGLAGTLVEGEWDSGEGNAADLDDFVAALLAALPGEEVDLYLNLHTASFPAGAIRGQLVAVPEPRIAALLAVALAGLVLGRRAGRRRAG